MRVQNVSSYTSSSEATKQTGTLELWYSVLIVRYGYFWGVRTLRSGDGKRITLCANMLYSCGDGNHTTFVCQCVCAFARYAVFHYLTCFAHMQLHWLLSRRGGKTGKRTRERRRPATPRLVRNARPRRGYQTLAQVHCAASLLTNDAPHNAVFIWAVVEKHAVVSLGVGRYEQQERQGLLTVNLWPVSSAIPHARVNNGNDACFDTPLPVSFAVMGSVAILICVTIVVIVGWSLLLVLYHMCFMICH